jgi:hypothetical protein
LKIEKEEICKVCIKRPATDTHLLFKKGKLIPVPVCTECETEWNKDKYFTGK